MQKRKVYEVELTDKQKERFDKIIDCVGDVNFIKLKEVEKHENVRDFPQYGDIYWYFDAYGVSNDIFQETIADNGLLEIGNCFKTEEEAEFELERHKVIAEMKKFAEPEDRGWYSLFISHSHICYNHSHKRVEIYDSNFAQSSDIYFEEKEDAQKCIDSVGEDRIKKYYLKVEE